MDYDASSFNVLTAESLLEQVVLAAMAAGNQELTRVKDLDILSESERSRIVARDSRKVSSELEDPWAMIIESCNARPDRVALVDESSCVSYRELMKRVDETCGRLAALGVQAGDVVTVSVTRNLHSIIAMLAALKLGACYVPVDSESPATRQAQIYDQVRPRAFLSSCAGGIDILLNQNLDGDSYAAPAGPESRAAYVLFTSGSTGAPKGVAISRPSISSLLLSTEEALQRNGLETWVSIHSFAFDASVWEIFGSLCFGDTLVVASESERRDPDQLVALMDRHSVSSLTISPTAFEGFRESAQRMPSVVFGLRRIILCAEPVSVPSIDSWFDHWSGTDRMPVLLNMYGITEATVHSTIYRMKHSRGERRNRIGYGLSDTPIYVVDDHGRLVPDGVAGEMLIGGCRVALGYVGPDRQMLDKRYIEDTISPHARGRLYKSGDFARRLSDGSLEFLGRRDRQLKIRGHRVEAGDIEAAALRIDGVKAARAWADPQGVSSRLCLGVEVGGADVSKESVAAVVREALPKYMVPGVVVVVDQFPTTTNGKLDTNGLLSGGVEVENSGGESEHAAEWENETERTIASAMGEVLAVDCPDRSANFFRLGGDSISAIRLVTSLRDLGIQVTLAEIYQLQTVWAIADGTGVVSDNQQPPRDRTLRDGIAGHLTVQLPATPLQRGMIYHNLLGSGSTYHDVLHYRIKDAPDGPLQPALDAVVQRHLSLRGYFLATNEGVLEFCEAETAQIELRVFDHSDSDFTEDARNLVRTWATGERQRGFSLDVPGLLRVALHKFREDCVLSLSVHHAVLDGWSAATFVAELLTLWAGGSLPLPSGRDRVVHEKYVQLIQQSQNDEGDRHFWRERVSAIGPDALDHSVRTGRPVDTVRVQLDRDICVALDSIAERLAVSVRSVFVTLHGAALEASWGESTPPVTGLVTGGRPEMEGATGVLGLFLNTLPVRMRLRGLSWRQAIQQTFQDEVSFSSHRRYPLADIQTAAGRRLIDVAFNYTDFYSSEPTGALKAMVAEGWYEERTEFPVLSTLNRLADGSGELVIVAQFGTEVRLSHKYANILRSMLRSLASGELDSPNGVIEITKDDSLLAEGTLELAGPLRPIDCNRLLGSIVRHATDQPDTVAVVDGDSHYTYERLWLEVSSVARSLEEKGVAKGSRVIIEGQRSARLVIATIATLALGASVVPVDPSLPERRRSDMSAAAGPVAFARITKCDIEISSGPGASDGSRFKQLQLPTQVDPEDEAYLLFTSGTTGTPRSVAMPFESVANLVDWQVRRLADGPRRVGLFAAVGFDVSIQEMLSCLSGGNTLVVIKSEVKIDPMRTLTFLRDEKIDTLFVPPLILRQLARAWRDDDVAPAMRTVIAAGERLIVDDTLRRFGTAAGFRLINQYGPTETHVVTEADLGADPIRWPDSPGIGLPIPNVVLHGNPNMKGPADAVELAVSGSAVALGYTDKNGKPARVAEFGRRNGRRYYQTGDLVRFSDGGLEYQGRIDSQLKVHGYRVDIFEVEGAIRALPEVADCLVRGRRGAHSVALEALIQLRRGQRLERHSLRAVLNQVLPTYAVPTRIEIVDGLPTDRRGKADDSALAGRRIRRRSAVGLTQLEQKILDAWADVLGHQSISTKDTFFDVGGSSILLLDLYMRLKTELNTSFEIRHLLQYPSISLFAEFVRSQEKIRGGSYV
ncbi:non-ribosomal peptide synthetase [Nesterenkonia alkaliphila]|nr:non-ribosomal peptide synthetase [Nesterenkonia alkaliphila]